MKKPMMNTMTLMRTAVALTTMTTIMRTNSSMMGCPFSDSFDSVWSDDVDGYAEFKITENKSSRRRFQRTTVNKMPNPWEKYSDEHVDGQFDSDWRRSNRDFREGWNPVHEEKQQDSTSLFLSRSPPSLHEQV